MINLYAGMYVQAAAATAVGLCGWIAGQLRDDHLNHQHEFRPNPHYRRSHL